MYVIFKIFSKQSEPKTNPPPENQESPIKLNYTSEQTGELDVLNHPARIPLWIARVPSLEVGRAALTHVHDGAVRLVADDACSQCRPSGLIDGCGCGAVVRWFLFDSLGAVQSEWRRASHRPPSPHVASCSLFFLCLL